MEHSSTNSADPTGRAPPGRRGRRRPADVGGRGDVQSESCAARWYGPWKPPTRPPARGSASSRAATAAGRGAGTRFQQAWVDPSVGSDLTDFLCAHVVGRRSRGNVVGDPGQPRTSLEAPAVTT